MNLSQLACTRFRVLCRKAIQGALPPNPRGLSLWFPGSDRALHPCAKKRSDPQITPRKPSTALRSLLSVALSSVMVKHLHYSTECGRCTMYDTTCPRFGEHFSCVFILFQSVICFAQIVRDRRQGSCRSASETGCRSGSDWYTPPCGRSPRCSGSSWSATRWRFAGAAAGRTA